MALEVVCPACRSGLYRGLDHWDCGACGRTFPVVAGIPDLRVAPDPWIGVEEDREKARRLSEAVADLGFPDAVRRYWEMTPSTPSGQARRFIQHVLDAEERSREWLGRTEIPEPVRPGEIWLDVGTGTGDVPAAAPDLVSVFGLDVALRWLVIARKRLLERGVEATFLCGNAEHLPFPDRAFSRVLCLGTLEHCPNPVAVLAEARRVLREQGSIRLRTVNRFSILPEPHVGLFGVGWLPRSWADPYVRLRRRGRYLHHRPLGSRELRRTLRDAGFVEVEVEPAPALEAETRRLGPWARRMVPHYDRLRSRRLLAPVVRSVAPLLEARGTAP